MHDDCDLIGALKELDAQWAKKPLSPEADLRIRAHLDEQRRPTSPILLWIGVPATVSVLGMAIFFAMATPQRTPSETFSVQASLSPDEPAELSSWFVVRKGRCATEIKADTLLVNGACTIGLHESAIEIAVSTRAHFARHARGIEMPSGQAIFEVAKVADGDPVQVVVRGGIIEVLGTRFEVLQRPTTGSVELLEGAIRFVHDDGREHSISEGERYSWGEEAGSARIRHRRSALKRSKAVLVRIEPSAAGLVEEVHRLRALRRYADAARLLRETDQRDWSRRTREVLSFELGTILDHQQNDPSACEHWRTHARRYPAGRYADEVARLLADPICR